MSINITYTPQRSEAVYEHSVSGDVLTVNGVSYDFGPLAEGEILPRVAVGGAGWLASHVTRTGGVIHLTMIEPYVPGGQE